MEKKSSLPDSINLFFLCLIAFAVLSCRHQAPKSATTAQADTTKIGANIQAPPQGAQAAPASTAPQVPVQPAPDSKAGNPAVVKDGKGGYILQIPNKRDPGNPGTKMLNNYNNSMVKLQPSAAVPDNPEQKQAKELYVSGSDKSLKGDQQGAIADYTESLKHFRMAITYVKRGYCWLLLGENDHAVNDFDQAIEMDPKQERAFFGRSVCRFETHDYKSAEADMEKFLERDRTVAMAYNYLAGCKFMEQDFKAALENYDIVVKMDPKFPDIYTNRGMMRHYLNDLKGAIEDYDKAISIDPKNATAYNNRGAARLNQNNSEGALEDFNKAISLKPDYADAFVNRGKAKSNLGDAAGACEDWQEAYKLGLEEARDLIAKFCKH